MALHGHATIELTDVESGKVTKIEEDNLVTNGLAKILQYVPTETNPPITKVLLDRTDSVDGSTGLERSMRMMTGGILLLDSELEENVDNIILPAGVRTVGCGATIAYNGTNVMAGSYNASESGKIENGYKHVWDFATSQANGQIASVCLTTREGGFAGAGTYPYDAAYCFSKNALGTDGATDLDCLSQRTGSQIGLSKEYDTSYYYAEQVLYADYDSGTMYGFADVEEWWFAGAGVFSATPTENNMKSFIYKKSLTLSKKRLMLKDMSIIDQNRGSSFVYNLVYPSEDGYGTRVLEEITVEMPDSLKEVVDTYMSKNGYFLVEHSCDEGFLYIFIYKDMTSTSNSSYVLADDTFHVWKINMSDFTSEHIQLQNRSGKRLFKSVLPSSGTQLHNVYMTNGYVLAITEDYNVYLINVGNSEDITQVLYPDGTAWNLGKSYFQRCYCIRGKIYLENAYVIDTVTKEVRRRNLYSGNADFGQYTNEATYVQGSNGMILFRYFRTYSGSANMYLQYMTLPEILITINNLSTPVTKTSAQSMKITYTITEE